MLTSRRAWISLYAISSTMIAAAAACGGGGDTTSSSSNGGASSTSTSSGMSSGKGGEGGELFPMSSSGTGGTGGTPVMCDPNPTQGTEVWGKGFGDASGQNGLSVATDAAGNVFVAGAFSGSITFGNTTLTSAGAADAFVAKLDPSGNPLWAKRFGDAKAQSALAVAVDKNGFVIIAGFFLGTINLGGSTFTAPGCCFEDIFLAKLDGNTGNHVWSKAFGDINTQRAFGLAVNANSDIAMVGTFQTSTDFGGGAMTSNGGDDAYVVVFNAGGTFKWQKQIGGANNDKATGVAFDASGNVLVAGTALSTVDMGGGMISPVGQEAAMVAKYDPNGAFLWGKLFGDNKAAAVGIGADASGNVLVAGDHEGAINFGNNPLTGGFGSNVFVVKLDGQGTHVWSHTYGDGSAQHTRGLVVDKSGLPIVAGNFAGMIDFGDGALTSAGTLDAFIAKLDNVGCQVWAKGLGDATSQDAAGVTVDASNNVLFTGTFSGSMSVGSTTLTSAGMSDVFIAKLNP